MMIKYNDYKKTINNICKKHSNNYIDFNDIFNQAIVLFYEAQNTWNKDKSKFNTYLIMYLNKKLKNYIYEFYTKYKIMNSINLDIIESPYIDYNYRFVSFKKNLKNSLSNNMVEMILNNPIIINKNIKYTYKKTKNRITINKIKKYYISKGYSHYKINEAINHIKSGLKDIINE